MNKKLLLIPILMLLLTGCGEVAKLNITTTEPITIDATEKLDPSIYLKSLDKNATVDYEIKDNELIISVTKGDKTTDFNVPIQVNEPKVSIDRHITVDKYVGYDLEQYIHEDEGVTHTTNFDEDTGKLSVTFTKGEWSTTLEDDVTVLDSNPVNNWPKTYTCCDSIDGNCDSVLTLNENGNFSHTFTGVEPYYGTFTYSNNSFYLDYNNAIDMVGIGDYNQFTQYTGDSMNGTPNYRTCTLIK